MQRTQCFPNCDYGKTRTTMAFLSRRSCIHLMPWALKPLNWTIKSPTESISMEISSAIAPASIAHEGRTMPDGPTMSLLTLTKLSSRQAGITLAREGVISASKGAA